MDRGDSRNQRQPLETAPGDRRQISEQSGGLGEKRQVDLEVLSRHSKSFLLPEGNAPALPPPREVGKSLELFLFVFFIATRALHPAFIDNAKEKIPGTDKTIIPFAKVTPVVGECIVTMIIGQTMTLYIGGISHWREIWRPGPLKVFCAIGFMYAWGDILEVLATSKVSGDAYQVLLQSKLLITALMMRCIKGTRTTRMQWVILAVVMISMSVYSIAGGAGKPKPIDPKYYKMSVKDYVAMIEKDGAEESIDMDYLFGVCMVVLKVIVSCLCAVLADKYMKDYKDIPIYIQLVQMKVAWLPMTVVYTFMDGETWVQEGGPMHGWNMAAVFILISFTVKFWATMYLLAILDSVLKNIGEASSVIVTFGLSIWVFHKSTFQLPAFLMVMAVTLSVVSYIESKAVCDKAKKYDEALSI